MNKFSATVALLGLGLSAAHAQVGPLDARNNLSDVANPTTSLRNLGGAPLAAFSPIFGTGADGALSCSSGTTTLTRDMNYTNVTVSGSCQIKTNSFWIRANGTCDLTNAGAGAIQNSATNPGNSAVGATGATLVSPGYGIGTLPFLAVAGATGGTGNTTTGNNPTISVTTVPFGLSTGTPGAGGKGGNGTSSGAAGLNGVMPNSFNTLLSQVPPLLTIPYGGNSATQNIISPSFLGGPGGQGGGDGTNAGGGGGSPGYGGGFLGLACAAINRGASTAVAALQAKAANGGNGGNAAGGNAGGGAGAGGSTGGVIYVVTETLLGSLATNALDASGGNGGAGGNGAGTGIGGTGGTGGGGGSIFVHVIGSTPSYTQKTASGAGAAATTATTTAGTAGGAGFVQQGNL